MEVAQDVLRHFLHYDPETGVFTRLRSMDGRHAASVGKPCGTVNKSNGYVEIQVARAKHYAHRLVWIWMHGAIPAGKQIDHANGCRSDNRLGNLRLASRADNLRNSKTRVDNKSGVKGVSWDAARGKWAVTVGRVKMGRFGTIEEATAVRLRAATDAFGAFANENRNVTHAALPPAPCGAR